jgi:hypothetical protein
MSGGHAEAVALMDRGRFDEAMTLLTRAIGDDATDHEALFLVGCLCFEGNEIDAHRAFVAALAARPGDRIYGLFAELAQKKLTGRGVDADGAAALVDPAKDAMRSGRLNAFPLAILLRLFERAGRGNFAAEAYERALRAQGREELAASFAQCKDADADWPWDMTIARLRRDIRDGAFGADDLAMWLRYVPGGRDGKTDALRRVLVQTVLTHHRGGNSGQSGVFGEPSLPDRCLVVTQVSEHGTGKQGDIWISPPRREWEVKVSADPAG